VVKDCLERSRVAWFRDEVAPEGYAGSPSGCEDHVQPARSVDPLIQVCGRVGSATASQVGVNQTQGRPPCPRACRQAPARVRARPNPANLR
jgi:hypothetical protein